MTEQFVDITADISDENARAGRARRWFTSPPGRVLGTGTVLNAALTVYAYSAPGVYLIPQLLAGFAWIGLGLAFVIKTGLALTLGDGLAGLFRHRWRWAGVPAVVLVTAALVASGLPVRAGLQLAAPDMLEVVRNPAATAPTRVGPYAIDIVERLPRGGVSFSVANTQTFGYSGFAYSPDGQPPQLRADMVATHLSGPWYAWEASGHAGVPSGGWHEGW